MRSAIVQLPDQRSAGEQRQVLGAAIRQLERGEIYLAAVAYMDLGDEQVQRVVNRLRADVAGPGRHLGEQRSRIHD